MVFRAFKKEGLDLKKTEEKYGKQSLSLTEEMVTEMALSSMQTNPDGKIDFLSMEFDARALELLHTGVKETLRQSKLQPNGGRIYLFMKRLVDVTVSFVSLVILLIPLLIVLLLVFLEDRANPIFVQERLTKDGKPFKMVKIRTMVPNAESLLKDEIKDSSDLLLFKNKNDSRVTKIGDFLRKTSIDELPQLWNVLKGDMSLVGPRPPLPREVVQYTPLDMERLLVKGGLACTAQCEGRSELDSQETFQFDREYIETRTFWGDIFLLFRIVIAVFKKKGAM